MKRPKRGAEFPTGAKDQERLAQRAAGRAAGTGICSRAGSGQGTGQADVAGLAILLIGQMGLGHLSTIPRVTQLGSAVTARLIDAADRRDSLPSLAAASCSWYPRVPPAGLNVELGPRRP